MKDPKYAVLFMDFSHNVVATLSSDSLPIVPRVGEDVQITNGDTFKLCRVIKIEHCINVADSSRTEFIVTIYVDFKTSSYYGLRKEVE